MKKLQCPSIECSVPVHGPIPGRFVRAGFYRKRSSRRKIQRYRCKNCGSYFSDQTLCPTFRQRKPELNLTLRNLLCSGVSQRRCARLLGVTRRTVTRKFRFMARQASIENEKRREELKQAPVSEVEFDDLLTSEHTKCKPLSVSLAIEAKTREILAIEVSRIPARHPLTQIAKIKYPPRPNERPLGMNRLFRQIKGAVRPDALFRSDSDPDYPAHLRRHFPAGKHVRVLSRRGRSDGFGELKRVGFDPIFMLNHTCAMLRGNINRLARKTWSVSKTLIGLILHLELYAHYHNSVLIKEPAR